MEVVVKQENVKTEEEEVKELVVEIELQPPTPVLERQNRLLTQERDRLRAELATTLADRDLYRRRWVNTVATLTRVADVAENEADRADHLDAERSLATRRLREVAELHNVPVTWRNVKKAKRTE